MKFSSFVFRQFWQTVEKFLDIQIECEHFADTQSIDDRLIFSFSQLKMKNRLKSGKTKQGQKVLCLQVE